MPIIAVSFCVVIAYIIMLILQKPHDRTGLDKGRIMDTVHLVRLFYIAGLCAVPALVAVSILRDNMHIYAMAETAVPIASGALFLVGLASLGQRSLAKHFNMHMAFQTRELVVMMVVPALLYITFLPGNNAVLFYMAPGLYSGYLIYMMKKKKA